MTPFALIVSIGLLLIAGLVIDGGRQLNGHGRAIAYAQEAARAAATALNVEDETLATLRVPQALAAARTYCAQAKAKDASLVSCRPRVQTITGQGDRYQAVAVRAEVRIDTFLLGIIGVGSLKASGAALARSLIGIERADQNKLDPVAPPSVDPPSSGGIATSVATGESSGSVPCVTVTPKPDKPPKKGDGKGKGKGNGKGKGKKPKPPKPTPSEKCAFPSD